jgi:DNA invertase Pin-like site-specific DNA recombinase
MAKAFSPNGTHRSSPNAADLPIPAYSYYRMSSREQDQSIDRQRDEVERYAQDHGYRILREYKDEAISGADTLKRKAFLRMHHDLLELGEAQAVLCWDEDRFGRFDSVEAGYWIKPLRDRGVRLVTVGQGVIDWHSFAGRITAQIRMDGKHEFLENLSRNVTSGLLKAARDGRWAGGPPPFGYAVDPVTKHLVPGKYAQALRRLFQGYADGKGVQQLADELEAAGIPPYRGASAGPSTPSSASSRARSTSATACGTGGPRASFIASSAAASRNAPAASSATRRMNMSSSPMPTRP